MGKKNSNSHKVFDYDGATFEQVKSVAFSGIYEHLPHHRGVGLTTLVRFCNDSSRNLSEKEDILPKFDKLIHAHGICFSGLWRIAEDSPYTGYFAKGAEGLLLARASVAGPKTTQGHRRAFGIAGKVFPTMDAQEKVMPGNFVTVSYLTGTKEKHITDIEMTNNPSIGPGIGANFINRVIFRLMDTRPGYRQLHPLSTLGLHRGDRVHTPDLLMLKLSEGIPQVDRHDFRDELRLVNYPNNKLIYTINVRNFDESEWKRIGTIELTEDAISEGGDKQLHFWIPRDIPSGTADAS